MRKVEAVTLETFTFGTLDADASPEPGVVSLRGGPADANATSTSITLHVYVDDEIVGSIVTDQVREAVSTENPG